MAEQTFRSPGFFEQEIDLSARQITPFGVPAGVIGTAQRGPAFVPITVGSFADFETKFGTLDSDRFGPYAVREFLKNRTALTYLRVLGAGANESTVDINNTRTKGIVKNAGFKLTPVANTQVSSSQGNFGCVQFLCAKHAVDGNQAKGYPIFTHNDSINSVSDMQLVRGVILTATGTQMQILDATASYVANNVVHGATSTGGTRYFKANVNTIAGSALTDASKYFKIVLSSSTGGANYGNDENNPGVRILSASLDPNSGQYISKILNTDPRKFQSEEHLLYLHFDVENELAPVDTASNARGGHIALLSGSTLSSKTGDTTVNFLNLFGRFDTRYTTPKTTNFISQPYGTKEYDLFNFETLTDGAAANSEFKISIANLRASTDPNYDYGTFEVQVRAFGDTDTNMQILERYPNITLDPKSERYIAKVIGDKKVYYDFDQEDPDERRLVVLGKYANASQRIRVRMQKQLEDGEVPADALPFGFRGIPVLKTCDSLTDLQTAVLQDRDSQNIGGARGTNEARLGAANVSGSISGSIVPPLPFRFKVTRGAVATAGLLGQPGTDERVDGRFYWGVKFEKIPSTAVMTNGILDTNLGNIPNQTVKNYTKFMGIEKLDSLITGSGKDEFNNNKFTLARVALMNAGTTLADVFNQMTGSAREHMKEACYVRNGDPDKNKYTITEGTLNRYTLASLVHTSSVLFNRFTSFAKYSNIFYGGFDGVNILDKDSELFRDKVFSVDTGGKSIDGDPDIGIGDKTNNPSGKGRQSNANASLRRAVTIMTDPMTTNINILAIPGVRDSFVTDHALRRVKENGMMMYIMDTVKYDQDKNRLYDDSTTRPNVDETSEQLETRALDNNYAATFFPDVFIDDPINNKVVKVPSSVAALATLGYNDNVAFPWFAPAGFNRGGLDFVRNVETRLSADDRDTLYDAKINPIAVFPRTGFVIFGQKTLQMAKSALDRINVRRLMLEVKRQVVRVADKILFEPNTPATRANFVARVTPLLGLIQAQAGVEQFKVVMDDTNNTSLDVEANRLNGRIIVVPTRAVEFIAIDFIITNSGVSFE